MEENRLQKACLNYKPGYRRTGRSKTRWKDEFSWRQKRPEGLILEEKGKISPHLEGNITRMHYKVQFVV
jgi:hypothetical protein